MKPRSRSVALRESRLTTAPVFLVLALLWTVFIQSALYQRHLSWFPLLFWARVGFAVAAAALAVVVAFRPIRNVLPLYLSVCLSFQAVFSVLEPPTQLEYYQYVSYLVLIAALAFQGTFRDWLKWCAPWHGAALVIPLFFKSHTLFGSVGAFAFNFTTPVVLAFLSTIVARVVTTRFEALEANLDLKERLLKVTEEAKTQLAFELNLARKQLAEDAKRTAFSEVALEVAHNLRSPLAALELKLREVKIEPEARASELRDSIHRIRDTANQLVLLAQKARGDVPAKFAVPSAREPYSEELIPMVVESIISEKRIEYRARSGIKIDYQHLPESYGLFARVQKDSLRDVISNLVNNSVEAAGDSGRIEVRVRPGAESGQVAITVTDDGPGISDEALARLGELGATVGKAGGTGVGLAHARASAERWGGLLRIERRASGGTLAEVTIPAVESPPWFAERLGLSESGTPVVVLDDDPGIGALWRSKLGAERVYAFQSAEKLRVWMAACPAEAKSAHYLVDLDLGRDSDNGLEEIMALGIGARSTLVTSYFDRADVQQDCLGLKMRILPKPMLSVVTCGQV